jgi:hypothetical protein
MVSIAPCSLRLTQRSKFANAYQGAADLLKGLSPTTSNQTALFFRIFVRFGLVAVTGSVAAWVDAAAFFCLHFTESKTPFKR